MAASTTIQDLPDDMLHEIFGHLFADEPEKTVAVVTQPPKGAHAALRCVCRRWRDIADWVRLSTATIGVVTTELADPGAIRARHPAAFKKIVVADLTDGHSTRAARAATSLIKRSADLQRALLFLQVNSCCLPALLPAVTPMASCAALTGMCLSWKAHPKERVVPSNALAPLSALRELKTLTYVHDIEAEVLSLPKSALLAPLPALPDAPRLTCLCLSTAGSFVPVGSDAALGRLRELQFLHKAPVQELMDAEDPCLLRAAFDAGTWQPSRLTGLQDLIFIFGPVRNDLRALVPPSPSGSPSGSEWAPLAGQVTKLDVRVRSAGYKRPSTGIVAGLGALTALRKLCVEADVYGQHNGSFEPVSLDRVHAPHLTYLLFDCAFTPTNVARFPNLVALFLSSMSNLPALDLRSLVARSSLQALYIDMRVVTPSLINLAELFVGGGGWPVLKELGFGNMVLEWDATGLAGAPTAAEFAKRVRQLLPSLVRVLIEEPSGPGAQGDPSRAGFVMACRRHVVPALLGLRAGGG